MINQLKDYQPIERLLEKVSTLLNAQAIVKANYESRVADDFAPIDLFSPTEPTLSTVLAYLFNPRQGHGQGTLFLDHFCEALRKSQTLQCFDSKGEPCTDNVLVPNLGKNTVARCEYPIEGGRLDILLKDSNGMIVIENKPWASEGKEQLLRYAAWADEESNGKPWLQVFISEYEPTSLPQSVANRKYREQTVWMSFRRLVDVLHQAACFAQSLLVRDFVELFIRYLKSNVIGENSMENKQLLDLLAKPENVQAAVTIGEMYEQIVCKAWDNFSLKLKDRSKDRYGDAVEFKADSSNEIGSNFVYFTFIIKGANNWGIHFGSEHRNFKLDSFFWGVGTLDNKVFTFDTQQALGKALREELMIPLFKNGAGAKNRYWPWYVYGVDPKTVDFDDPYTFNRYVPNALATAQWLPQMLHDVKTKEDEPQLMKLIFSKVDAILDHLNKHPDLKSRLVKI